MWKFNLSVPLEPYGLCLPFSHWKKNDCWHCNFLLKICVGPENKAYLQWNFQAKISLKSNAHVRLFQSAKYEVVIYNMELLLADSDWAPRIMFPLRILFIFLLRGSVSLFCKTSISAALKMKLDLNHFVQSTGCKKSMLIFHSPEGAFVNFISISIFFHPGERGFGWC